MGKRRRAINIRGINPKTRKKLKNEGIQLDDGIFEIGSYDVLRQAPDSYENFKEMMCNTFQPSLIDTPQNQVENTARALSYCAIGRYQILPVYHFDKMGWSTEGEEGLRNIYEFICSQEKQDTLNLKILEVMARRFDGDIHAIAVHYYSGKGEAMLNYKRNLKLGKDTSEYDWLKKKQVYGYTSIYSYADNVAEYFQEIYGQENETKIDPNNQSMILALQEAIARKETGGSGRRQIKAEKSSVQIV